jgi:signal transduction histidine kinase
MLGTVRETWPVPDATARNALTFVLEIEHAPMGMLLLSNKAADALEPAIGVGLSDDVCVQVGSQKAGVGPIGVAFAEHRRVAIRDIREDGIAEPRFRDFAQLAGFRGLDVIPLLLEDDRPIGAVAVFFPGVRRASRRSAMLAESSGRLLAIALENTRLRADAQQRRDIIDQLSRARIRFVARLSHEMRTPLQSIMGYVDLIATEAPESLTARQRHMLDRIRASEQLMVAGIDDLVAVARLEAGRLTYEPTDVDVCAAIAAAADIIQPIAARKGQHIAIVHAPSDGPMLVRADDAKVKQVLVNLLANAVQLTRPGWTIEAGCRAESSDVVIEICDRREEMSPAVVEGALEQFIRLDDEDGRLTGSELGLAISREFVHAMGGSLSAKHKHRNGAVVTVRLPRAPRS